jgi:starch-binding outer membrane protein, SusD/RagB family
MSINICSVWLCPNRNITLILSNTKTNIKMKYSKIISAGILSMSALIYTACNEKNIDLQPLSPTESSFFSKEDDFRRLTLGTYARLTYFYNYSAGGFIHGFWLLPGDDITTSGQNGFELFNLQPADGAINSFYSNAYIIVNRANTLIQKLDQESGILNATTKSSLRGEALFLKGYANMQLWNYFGTSPNIKERIQDVDKTTPSNSAQNELLDEAIKNLTEAANLLPTSWVTSDRGRVTKNSANGMLGKALVLRASVTKNTADYTAAIAAFDKISGASLLPNFTDNFAGATENGSESLFEFQASQPDFDNVWLNEDFSAGGVGSTSAYWGFYENSFSLFGTPKYVASRKLINAYTPGDPRLMRIIDADGTFKKYWGTGDVKTQAGVGSANNPRILRLADVLLLRAEALVESNGSTTEAIRLINQVRTRARGTGAVPANYSETETNRTTIFNWIAGERMMELAGEEGHRWTDLRRWHLGGKINLASGFDWGSVRNDVKFDVTKNLVYPIPSNEINLNPNIKQNPNY